ncbi:copper transporter [Nocardioides sp. CPCC 205120]|uniref:copper transporter n=1 Tax=Nocardioides sp. CPCC 205120 TaxID=3406462 RepID=UPI003B513BFB
MITFRQHLVTLVAVFAALAVGVVLGGGPLSEVGRNEPAAAPSTTRSDDGLRASYGDEFAARAAPALYGERLSGQQVALVTLAGADPEVVDGVVGQVEAAGAQVAARYDGRERLTLPDDQGMADSLATRLVEDLELAETVPSDLPSHERVGRLVGRAIASTQAEGEEADAAAGTILEALRTGEMLDGPATAPGRVPLVLVVLGEDRDDPQANALVAGLTEGLAAAAAGEVVVGTTASGEDGTLAQLRSEVEGVSTVDGGDTTVGQVSTVLALAAALDGTTGAFGASGADGAVPVG